QQEPSIAVNPLNPLNIVASAKDERSAPAPNTATKEVWEYTSTDGGVTWFNQHAPVLGPNAVRQSDPINVFRDDGRAFACYLGYNDSGGFTDTGIYVTQSTDGGFTWGNTVLAVPEVITGNPTVYSTDKQWLAVDDNPASPFYHRMYLSWTEFGGCSACIHFVYSTDGGLTWSPRTFQLSASGNQQFSMPTVLWNGNVFVNWAQGGTIFYRISTDGGVTFSAQTTAGTMNTNLTMAGRNWRISAIPVAAADRATPANIVIVWNDGRNNATNGLDVYYIRSTNGGTAWTAPARLNDDPTGVVRHQAEPWVTTSPNGIFHSIWYDEREETGSTILQHIYYTQSTDAGATWSSDVRTTDAATNLNIGIPQGTGWNGAAGDYINVTATNSDVYGAWTDTRSGTNEDIYTFHAGLTSAGTNTPTPTPTRTNTPTATRTPTSTRTNTPTSTPTLTYTPTSTATDTPTSTPTDTATDTPTVTPTDTPVPPWVLVGHVTWQGRPPQPNALQALPISLTLRLASGGPASEYTGLTTDASGFFTVPVGTLPNGTYNWRVKDPKYLANGGSITLSGTPVTNAEMGLMRAGDATDNNVVDSTDFTILRASFGKASGQPGYDDRADFTGDLAVNASDFSLLRSNFGTSGAPPIGPATASGH
ncbi:MAG: dockerin type I domain-containing protein, partial [Chloroflexia bacterium]